MCITVLSSDLQTLAVPPGSPHSMVATELVAAEAAGAGAVRGVVVAHNLESPREILNCMIDAQAISKETETIAEA